jgi:hypothetical protein
LRPCRCTISGAAGQFFQTKGRGNGNVLALDGQRVYAAGATECVKAFRPKTVNPYHYRRQDPEEFKAALKGEPVGLRLRNWYPPAGGAGQ